MPPKAERKHGRRAEEELRESEQRYRGLIENMREGLAYCRMLFADGRPQDFVYLAVNPAFESLTGIKNAVGRKVSEVIPGIRESDPQLFEIYGRVASGGAPERFETYMHALQQWFSISVFSPKDKHFVAVFDLISERKRAEETLAQEQFLMQTLMNYIPDYIYFKDGDSRFIRIGKALAKLFGLSDPAQAVGKTDRDFFSEEHARQAYEDEQAIIRTGQPVTKEERETWPDRPDTWVSTTKAPLRDEAGNAVGTFGISRDITERKRAEEALRRSEVKYRSLVDNAVFGIYRSTLDGRLLAANPALVAMLGYGSEEELLSVDMARNIYADPAERQRLVAQHGDAVRIEGLEVAWKRKDGGPITVRLSGHPIHTADGVLEGFEMVVEDVTERRILEDQLRQAQRMEAVGQLAGGVAHDFNNLLTAVLASCGLLDSGLAADSPLRDDVETIYGAGQRGAELTQKLLAFSRRQALDLHPVPLGTVATNFVRLARRVVPENVEIVLQVTPGDDTIRADAGALDQILMNLVTNARDAMPTGGKMLIAVGHGVLDAEHRRTYGWGRCGAYVTLAVSDTGIGMDADTRRRIFEPFFTTKPLGQGTGLGMSVVYGLVKEHEGFVHVYSEVGQGTTVRLYWPAIAGQGAEPVRPTAPEVHGGTETILVVEDDEAVRRAGTRVLERFGYRVLSAPDGWEALEILRTCERPPDLIVSDVIMPRISGPQLLSKLREAGPVPKMLFTSGYTGREALEQAELEPGVPLLAKPWTVNDLLRKVREVLDAPAPT